MSLVVAFVAVVAGQDVMMDPQMQKMAMGLASQVASTAMDQGKTFLSKEMAKESVVEPCMGPECCQASSCMLMPGMGCSGWRGPTKCVGATHISQGSCACLAGQCSADGKCPEVPNDTVAALGSWHSPSAFYDADDPKGADKETSNAVVLANPSFKDFALPLGLFALASLSVAVVVGSSVYRRSRQAQLDAEVTDGDYENSLCEEDSPVHQRLRNAT